VGSVSEMFLRPPIGPKRALSAVEGDSFCTVDGECPTCGESSFKVRGTGKRIGAHDEWHADGFAICCDEHVGTLVVKVDTIFGIEEDEAVLNGRARVYGGGTR